MTAPTDLTAGDEAWCLLDEPFGRAGRRNLVGAARVRVESVDGETYRVVILLANPAYMMGRRLEKRRGQLYATSGPEHAAFSLELRRFWGAPS
jgi:hypothetical protein